MNWKRKNTQSPSFQSLFWSAFILPPQPSAPFLKAALERRDQHGPWWGDACVQLLPAFTPSPGPPGLPPGRIGRFKGAACLPAAGPKSVGSGSQAGDAAPRRAGRTRPLLARHPRSLRHQRRDHLGRVSAGLGQSLGTGMLLSGTGHGAGSCPLLVLDAGSSLGLGRGEHPVWPRTRLCPRRELSHPGQATGSHPDLERGECCPRQGAGSVPGLGSSPGQGARSRCFCPG